MSASANSFEIRPDWLAPTREAALDPSQPIIDAHHHLYDRPHLTYLLPDYLDDLDCDHNVVGSVFVQARAMLRADGPPEYAAIGETEFINGVAAMSASGIYGPPRICAGIVGFADLMLGESVLPILEHQIMAGGGLAGQGGRFCGIRQTLCWDEDSSLLNTLYPTTRDMMSDSRFLAGFAEIDRLGLSFEAWAFFPQLGDVARLARTFPNTQIVVNHCGGLLRVHRYANQSDLYACWAVGISELAQCPNVTIKLSGLGMRISAFAFGEAPAAPSSECLAEAWRPWIDHCLAEFGPARCMWGSNFPVDKGSYSFGNGLNAMKRLTAGYGPSEKNDIFWRTAAQVYRLGRQIAL